MLELQIPSPIQELKHPLFSEKKVRVYVKRDDLIHPIISGNKWRKLKYNILRAKQNGYTTIVSFGGAYSNHIHALAKAAQMEGLNSIGIIRGEELNENSNKTLSDAKDYGMKLNFINREDYNKKEESEFINGLNKKFGNFYLIPEGGRNAEGVNGCKEIVEEIKIDYDYICVACGTGTTIAGIISALPNDKKVIGIPVLKRGDFLNKEIQDLISLPTIKKKENWQLATNYHFGGYGKWNQELLDFIQEFRKTYQILLEPIYTGKMMFGVFDLIKNDFFPKGSSIITLHTGGLQGII